MHLNLKDQIKNRQEVNLIGGVPRDFFTKCLDSNCKTGIQYLESQAKVTYPDKTAAEFVASACENSYQNNQDLSCQMVAQVDSPLGKELQKKDEEKKGFDFWGLEWYWQKHEKLQKVLSRLFLD